MYCRECSYSLEGLASGACPECARPFDLADPKSFDIEPRNLRGLPLWVPAIAGGWLFIIHGWLLVMLCVARLVLGRWPIRGGFHDPKGIDFVSAMHFIGILMMYGALISVPCVLIAPWFVRRGRRAATFSFCVLAWGLGFLAIRWDPALVFHWFMD